MKRKKKMVMCSECGYTWLTSRLPAGDCPKCLRITNIKGEKSTIGQGKLLWKNEEGN